VLGGVILIEMTTCTDTDRAHLERAIELARNGVGAVKPNPVVGAVVARDGEVLGEGWHEEYGGVHAEVNAIEACGVADLSGATLYVSLEPCCHEGKTPPCTDAILQAGIRRVFVASDDPTEKASGRGLGILRDEGVEVLLADGELAAACAAAQPGLPQARTRRAPMGAVQVGDDARRQGRHAHRRLASGSAARTAASWLTAGGPRSMRWSWASARRSRTTRG
jgi:pyrimidine deaminase RibD-like protein